MIEKLKVVIKPEDWNLPVNELEMRCLKNLLLKVDELVDAVNVLQAQVAILQEHAHPTATTEPTDPYAEQRKWIGKLCWFWDYERDNATLGFLTDIYEDEDDTPFRKDKMLLFKHCKPVKPTDDIIYKGGDNDNT